MYELIRHFSKKIIHSDTIKLFWAPYKEKCLLGFFVIIFDLVNFCVPGKICVLLFTNSLPVLLYGGKQ